MKADQRVITRLRELIEEGHGVAASPIKVTGVIRATWVDSGRTSEWRTKASSLLGRSFGEDSEYHLGFARAMTSLPNLDAVVQGLGVLRAALSDCEGGHLFRVQDLVHADVLDDFGTPARALFKSGYPAPAAVVAGCILEDALRTLCGKAGIALDDRPKLDFMNSQLAARAVYTKLVQKRITALADVRNLAAHGKWDQVKEADVEDMLSYVERFVAEHLT